MQYVLRTITKSFQCYCDRRYSVSAFQKTYKKRFKPVSIDGCVRRLDMATGELTNYSRKDFENSILRSQNRSLNQFRDIVNANFEDWQYFGTLTFDKSKVDRLDDNAVINAYEKFINNLKHKYKNLVYIVVPERHKKDGALHFHLLLGKTSAEELKLVDSGKRQRSGKNKGAIIYNCNAFKYGFTTITEIKNVSATLKYMEKYMSKSIGGSTFRFKKRFYYSRNLKKPCVFKQEFLIDHKVDLEDVGFVNVNNLYEKILYFSKEKNFLIKRILTDVN